MNGWRTVKPHEVARLVQDPVDTATLQAAAAIVDSVRQGGVAALRAHAERLGDLTPQATLIYDKQALRQARDALPKEQQALLERTAARIASFATLQRAALAPLNTAVPGGRAGHSIAAVERAGCYAPGGRFPLPSSVLMTAVTAQVAGVPEVWVASPKPTQVTLAAASIADAAGLLAVGGAQAIAALAFGCGEIPACDAVVGPGNRWVTAAKQWVAGRVAIDMLAGPSELTVLADGSANPQWVAADLLAQAEHDPDALPTLVSWDSALINAVAAALQIQLQTLPTAETARAALRNGFAVLCQDAAEAAAVCNMLAPEHLEVQVADLDAMLPRLSHYGALFVGGAAAEVFGDYGVGPNHVLPTGNSARFTGGLSVLTFLRVRTWLRLDDPPPADLIADAAALARLEGLEAHARAALIRHATIT